MYYFSVFVHNSSESFHYRSRHYGSMCGLKIAYGMMRKKFSNDGYSVESLGYENIFETV